MVKFHLLSDKVGDLSVGTLTYLRVTAFRKHTHTPLSTDKIHITIDSKKTQSLFEASL